MWYMINVFPKRITDTIRGQAGPCLQWRSDRLWRSRDCLTGLAGGNMAQSQAKLSTIILLGLACLASIGKSLYFLSCSCLGISTKAGYIFIPPDLVRSLLLFINSYFTYIFLIFIEKSKVTRELSIFISQFQMILQVMNATRALH